MEEKKEMKKEKRERTDVIVGIIELEKEFLGEASELEKSTIFITKSTPFLYIGIEEGPYSNNNLIIKKERIEPCHASIRWIDGKFFLQDESSQEVIYLDGEKLISYISKPLKEKFNIKIRNILLKGEIKFPKYLKKLDEKEEIKEDKEDKIYKEDKKRENDEEDFIIAEFYLRNLNSPYSIEEKCEIKSNKLTFIIGKSDECDYKVNEIEGKYVSKKHAMIIYSPEDGTFTIKNLHKNNSTFVNGKKVENYEKLRHKDIIKLGIASNAPKYQINFYEEEEEEEKKEKLEEKKEIKLKDDKEKKERKEEKILKTEIKKDLSENLEEDKIIKKKVKFSEIVPFPKRGDVYGIGKGSECTFKIDNPNLPSIVAEIIVPERGDFFLVRKKYNIEIPIKIDNKEVSDDIKNLTKFSINQVLNIGNFYYIKNDYRTIPELEYNKSLKEILRIVLILLIISFIFISSFLVLKKYLEKLNFSISTSNLMKKYQKNIFYILIFQNNISRASGTGFLYIRKDAYEKNIYYVITAKHVIQPWKFKKHKVTKDNKIIIIKKDKNGKEIKEIWDKNNYYIAVFPYNIKAFDIRKETYILENSFTNYKISQKLGDLKIYKIGEDEYKEIDNEYKVHKKNSINDIAIIRLYPKKDWKYKFESWAFTQKDKLDVGEKVIVFGFPLGGNRLKNRQGLTIPASCEGQLTSDCIYPNFLEINVNQNQGASGGPVINYKGEILGIISFSDKDKKLIYGIHGKIILNLLKE